MLCGSLVAYFINADKKIWPELYRKKFNYLRIFRARFLLTFQRSQQSLRSMLCCEGECVCFILFKKISFYVPFRHVEANVITIMQIKANLGNTNARHYGIFNIILVCRIKTHAFCMHIINTVIFIDSVSSFCCRNSYKENRSDSVLFDLQFHFHTQYKDNHQLINIISFLFIAHSNPKCPSITENIKITVLNHDID